MKFGSTRSSKLEVSFREAVLGGLAEDGGLYYPLEIPTVTSEVLTRWRALNYTDLACEILGLYSGTEIPQESICSMVTKAAKEFRLPTWTRLKSLDPGISILELFHGPSYSFKDYAMCLTGNLVEYFLQDSPIKWNLLVATSGDTGSSALEGFRRCEKVNVHIMFPNGRVSEIQRRQMTCSGLRHVECLAVEGTFDDCQRLLKEAFADKPFREKYHLLAVNSVNFARLVCQMVYYFWSVFRLQEDRCNEGLKVDFAVPTGNFGNVLAGYYAKRMGCNIGKLIIASNENDILTRVHKSGKYELKPVIPTISPSIDIQVSSNFERLVQQLMCAKVDNLFESIGKVGEFALSSESLMEFHKDFSAFSCSEKQTLETCKDVFQTFEYVIDPHTAVAFSAAKRFLETEDCKSQHMVVISTAHPAKFPEVLTRFVPLAIVEVLTPPKLSELLTQSEDSSVVENTIEALKATFR